LKCYDLGKAVVAARPREALRWEEHKERTGCELLASGRKPEALTALLEFFPDVTVAAASLDRG
jgi:hypothetical protein